jgi:hypothetical protein
MRWYDFMTLFWAALWSTALGVLAFGLSGRGVSEPEGWFMGGLAAASGAVMVCCWRIYKDPS